MGTERAGRSGEALNMFLGTGQSTAEGYGSVPVISTEQRHDGLMFVGGAQPIRHGLDAPAAFASLVPLVERQNGNWGETPCSGFNDFVSHRTRGKAHRLLVATAGVSGSGITDLNTGPNWALARNCITYAQARAAELGKPLKLRGFGFNQMHTDYIYGTTPAAWRSLVSDYFADLTAHVTNTTGQIDQPVVIATQVCVHASYGHANDPTLALELRNLCRFLPHYHLACPDYILPKTDGVHYSAVGSKVQGAYWARVYHQAVVEGREWEHLDVERVTTAGNKVTLRFNNRTPLAWDTRHVGAVADYGFSMTDGAGLPIALARVELVSASQVAITAATAPSSAAIHYGRGGSGNLRDSAGDKLVFSAPGVEWPMHNWLPILKVTLP